MSLDFINVIILSTSLSFWDGFILAPDVENVNTTQPLIECKLQKGRTASAGYASLL